MHEQTSRENVLFFNLIKSVHVYLFGEFWGGGGREY